VQPTTELFPQLFARIFREPAQPSNRLSRSARMKPPSGDRAAGRKHEIRTARPRAIGRRGRSRTLSSHWTAGAGSNLHGPAGRVDRGDVSEGGIRPAEWSIEEVTTTGRRLARSRPCKCKTPWRSLALVAWRFPRPLRSGCPSRSRASAPPWPRSAWPPTETGHWCYGTLRRACSGWSTMVRTNVSGAFVTVLADVVAAGGVRGAFDSDTTFGDTKTEGDGAVITRFP